MTKDTLINTNGTFFKRNNFYFIKTNIGNFIYDANSDIVEEYNYSLKVFESSKRILPMRQTVSCNIGDYIGHGFEFISHDVEEEEYLNYEYATD